MPKTKHPLVRFYEKTQRTKEGCILWTRALDNHGYGKFNLGGGSSEWERAHRWIWAHHHGPIPEGMMVRHTCDTPACVETSHLVLGTQSDNMQDCVTRGRNPHSSKAECVHGHPFNEENTYLYRGVRHCRTCRRDRAREWHRKNAIIKEHTTPRAERRGQ